jgi:predicted Zn-dependent protease
MGWLALSIRETARAQTEGVPRDPFAVIPETPAQSTVAFRGNVPAFDDAVEYLLKDIHADDDFVGIYAGGCAISALADSAGSFHWYSSDSFFVDYSLWLANGRAIKSFYAGRDWQQNEFLESVETARSNLEFLKRPVRTLKTGAYRVFLAPSANRELLSILSWGALSEDALQRSESPLCAVRRGEKSFSPLFSLKENFLLGLTPRFCSQGELSAETVTLIEKGHLVQALCSARTAKEFGVVGNGASSEALRTPEMGNGTLLMKEALNSLGTGLYISDLHYLNWSDRIHGRVTGMTRYGCLWVENGVPVGPIQDMRFDETIFRCFGSQLEAVTSEMKIYPETSTYHKRALGGCRVPGILLSEFNFTL